MVTAEDQSGHTAPVSPQMAVKHNLFEVSVFSKRVMTSLHPIFSRTDVFATYYLKAKVALKTVVREQRI